LDEKNFDEKILDQKLSRWLVDREMCVTTKIGQVKRRCKEHNSVTFVRKLSVRVNLLGGTKRYDGKFEESSILAGKVARKKLVTTDAVRTVTVVKSRIY
jgi:hypothetical protein